MTMNTKESQYVGKVLFTDWKPTAYFDFHHMGSYGARIFFPPYAEPVRPLADPLVWREMAWYGAQMANKAEEAGLSGVMNDGQYSGWGHFGFHWITPFHNITGMLTESASAKLASPLYIDPSQLDRPRAQPRGPAPRPDELPEPLARRLVAPPRHRRTPEGRRVGAARLHGAQQRDDRLGHLSRRRAGRPNAARQGSRRPTRSRRRSTTR